VIRKNAFSEYWWPDFAQRYSNIPPRHAEIVDWPDEKSKRKEIALELAEKTLLILRPD
jgi:hypothetical protein